jgi:DGQHR domain-containing protein
MPAQAREKSDVRILGAVVTHRSYSATMPPDTARELLFISTYDSTDPKSPAVNNHGYQRPPTPARFGEIATYYRTDQNKDVIPPLLVSVRTKEPKEIDRLLDLLGEGKIGDIHPHFGPDILSVVDGQHRLKGLTKAMDDDPNFSAQIPMMLYFGLTFAEEADLFNTINVTQRKLPKALIETTRGDITEAGEISYNQQIRRIAFKICRDSASPWGPIDGREQINMTGIRDANRPVTYEGLRRSTGNMFPATLLERIRRTDPDLPASLAIRYWDAVKAACPEGWTGQPSVREVFDSEQGETVEEPIKYRLKDLVGVAALARLGQDVIRTHLDTGREKCLEDLVEKLREVNWEKDPKNPWMQSPAGFAGQKELYEVLYAWVYSDIAPEGL